VAEVRGGGWNLTSFKPGNAQAVVLEYRSVTKSNLHLLDLASGRMTPIVDHGKPISYADAQFAPDGSLWVLSDEGSEFQRLGTLEVSTGRFAPKTTAETWDVDEFDIAPDGSFVAYVVNEAGVGKLKLLDTQSGAVRAIDGLPSGQIGGVSIAPWGAVGLSFTSAKTPSDAFSVDARTLALTRWTESETGGLDAAKNAEPELVEVQSFDGLEISGFLYRPDAAAFPGRRPLIVNIHGGPEGQSRPGFLGRTNYYINELGIAVFYPNVRGSTGYGKEYAHADDVEKRMDSVRDLNAAVDWLIGTGDIDPDRIGVMGGSYGGFMTLAAITEEPKRWAAAIDSFGIANFETFLDNTGAWRRRHRAREYGSDPAFLKTISPIFKADRIETPLMVIQGDHDVRVPPEESEQIVNTVRRNEGIVEYVVFEREGHGIQKLPNRLEMARRQAAFLREHLVGA
jgi:dipeptidyl aminopeptidase/acylaminoacyl peptidase